MSGDVNPPSVDGSRLQGRGLTLGYDGKVIVSELDLQIPDREFTVIIGPNGCGKSTLLKGLARLLKPSAGTVLLDGQDIHRYRSTDVARRLSLLPQGQTAPSGTTVGDLARRGRYAHQSFLRRWSEADAEAVARALADTGLTDLADAQVEALSGGQRQRAWLSAVLSQQAELLLLDEPTTYLDIAHQMEVLELCSRLHQQGRTVVAVLHDLNHAARFATHVVAMRDGRVVAQGAPREVFTAETVEMVFGWPCTVVEDPVNGTPLVIPLSSAGFVAADRA